MNRKVTSSVTSHKCKACDHEFGNYIAYKIRLMLSTKQAGQVSNSKHTWSDNIWGEPEQAPH